VAGASCSVKRGTCIFVGIGGIGMSGIAELLANLGYVVSGSGRKAIVGDRSAGTLGIRIALGQTRSTSAMQMSW